MNEQGSFKADIKSQHNRHSNKATWEPYSQGTCTVKLTVATIFYCCFYFVLLRIGTDISQEGGVKECVLDFECKTRIFLPVASKFHPKVELLNSQGGICLGFYFRRSE